MNDDNNKKVVIKTNTVKTINTNNGQEIKQVNVNPSDIKTHFVDQNHLTSTGLGQESLTDQIKHMNNVQMLSSEKLQDRLKENIQSSYVKEDHRKTYYKILMVVGIVIIGILLISLFIKKVDAKYVSEHTTTGIVTQRVKTDTTTTTTIKTQKVVTEAKTNDIETQKVITEEAN